MHIPPLIHLMLLSCCKNDSPASTQHIYIYTYIYIYIYRNIYIYIYIFCFSRWVAIGADIDSRFDSHMIFFASPHITPQISYPSKMDGICINIIIFNILGPFSSPDTAHLRWIGDLGVWCGEMQKKLMWESKRESMSPPIATQCEKQKWGVQVIVTTRKPSHNEDGR